MGAPGGENRCLLGHCYEARLAVCVLGYQRPSRAAKWNEGLRDQGELRERSHAQDSSQQSRHSGGLRGSNPRSVK